MDAAVRRIGIRRQDNFDRLSRLLCDDHLSELMVRFYLKEEPLDHRDQISIIANTREK